MKNKKHDLCKICNEVIFNKIKGSLYCKQCSEYTKKHKEQTAKYNSKCICAYCYRIISKSKGYKYSICNENCRKGFIILRNNENISNKKQQFVVY